MSRKNWNSILRSAFFAIDRWVLSNLSMRTRQRFIQYAYHIREKFIHARSPAGAATRTVKSVSINTVWPAPKMPGWVLDEMLVIGKNIDAALFPADNFESKCNFYSYPVIPSPGNAYWRLMGQCHSAVYTHCFIISYFTNHESDSSSCYIKFLLRQPNSRILVLITGAANGEQVFYPADCVDIININNLKEEISHEEIILVVVRLLLQLKIFVVHLLGSHLGWEVLSRFALPLSSQMRIFVSISDDYDAHGKPAGFSRDCLSLCYQYVSKVFVGNASFSLALQKFYGYPAALFEVLKKPFEANLSQVTLADPPPKRVLWVGSIEQKNEFEMLIEVSGLLRDFEFLVYFDFGVRNPKELMRKIKKKTNVTLLPELDAFREVSFQKIAAILCGPRMYACPSVLLAAAMSQVPIIASKIYGMQDFLNNDRSYVIKGIDNAYEYVESLAMIFEDISAARLKASNARSFLQSEHAPEIFQRAIANVPGYNLDAQDLAIST